MNVNRNIAYFTGIVLLNTTLAVNAATVTNGSFEQFSGSVRADGGIQLLPGSLSLTGWEIIGNEIALLTPTNKWDLTASDGDNFIDMTGYSNIGYPKGISQTITGLVVGNTYTFSMDLGISNDNTACSNCGGPIFVETSIGATSQVFSHTSSEPGNIWSNYGYNFVADNVNMELTILGTSASGINMGVDNVSVSAVPLPASVLLFLSGIAAISSLKVRRVFRI